MKVFRISNCKYIDDLTGTGASTYAGRWHSKGTYVLYTAASASLSLLESVVHISTIPITGYCMITLELPEDNIQELKIKDLPVNWHQYPSPDALKVVGDMFISNNNALALKLPSAIMPEDYNYLINPNNADFKKIKVLSKRQVLIDSRLLRN